MFYKNFWSKVSVKTSERAMYIKMQNSQISFLHYK